MVTARWSATHSETLGVPPFAQTEDYLEGITMTKLPITPTTTPVNRVFDADECQWKNEPDGFSRGIFDDTGTYGYRTEADHDPADDGVGRYGERTFSNRSPFDRFSELSSRPLFGD